MEACNQKNRRRLALAARASQAGQHISKSPIAMPLKQQPRRDQHHSWRARAAYFQAALRPFAEPMVEAELRRVHRGSVDLSAERIKNIGYSVWVSFWLGPRGCSTLCGGRLLGWSRRPSCDGPSTPPRLGIVRDPGKPAPQLDGCGQLAVLVEDGTDRGGIFFGHGEHLMEVAVRAMVDKPWQSSRCERFVWRLVSYMLPPCMVEARQYETQDGSCPFDRWFNHLEARAAVRVTRVVAKLERGLRPDVKSVGEGVMETRIDYGPGYRVYFGLDGVTLVILLGGGDKKTQQHDIQDAQAAWADYKARKKKGTKNDATHP